MKIPMTHKGWFGICPVYFGNLNSESPLVVERHRLLLPLMMFSEFVYWLVFQVVENPRWPLVVTDEIPPGKYLDVPDGGVA